MEHHGGDPPTGEGASTVKYIAGPSIGGGKPPIGGRPVDESNTWLYTYWMEDTGQIFNHVKSRQCKFCNMSWKHPRVEDMWKHACEGCKNSNKVPGSGFVTYRAQALTRQGERLAVVKVGCMRARVCACARVCMRVADE